MSLLRSSDIDKRAPHNHKKGEGAVEKCPYEDLNRSQYSGKQAVREKHTES